MSGKKITKIKAKKGDYIFITSGEVEIESTVSTKSETFSVGYCWTRKDFDFIGEFSLCTGNSDSAARAIARKDSTLLQFTETELLSLAQHEPRIAVQFLEDLVCILSDQLAIADKRLQDH
jgi:CRP-like cAMP-binding protein